MAWRDRGMVTAELAVALPVLVLVVAGLLAGVGVGVDQEIGRAHV